MTRLLESGWVEPPTAGSGSTGLWWGLQAVNVKSHPQSVDSVKHLDGPHRLDRQDSWAATVAHKLHVGSSRQLSPFTALISRVSPPLPLRRAATVLICVASLVAVVVVAAAAAAAAP